MFLGSTWSVQVSRAVNAKSYFEVPSDKLFCMCLLMFMFVYSGGRMSEVYKNFAKRSR